MSHQPLKKGEESPAFNCLGETEESPTDPSFPKNNPQQSALNALISHIVISVSPKVQFSRSFGSPNHATINFSAFSQ